MPTCCSTVPICELQLQGRPCSSCSFKVTGALHVQERLCAFCSCRAAYLCMHHCLLQELLSSLLGDVPCPWREQDTAGRDQRSGAGDNLRRGRTALPCCCPDPDLRPQEAVSEARRGVASVQEAAVASGSSPRVAQVAQVPLRTALANIAQLCASVSAVRTFQGLAVCRLPYPTRNPLQNVESAAVACANGLVSLT